MIAYELFVLRRSGSLIGRGGFNDASLISIKRAAVPSPEIPKLFGIERNYLQQ